MAPGPGALSLRRVGVSGVRKPISVQRPGRVVTLSAEFAVHVDLPADRKGSDLSRNAQLLTEVLDATAERPVRAIEGACLDIARELLARHPYAQDAEVEARAEYFLPRGVSADHIGVEDFTLVAGARAARAAGKGASRRWVGAEAVGMTACPCAMEVARGLLEAEYPLLKDPSLATLPILTHNQRNRTRIVLELDGPAEVEADTIIEVIEAAQSSPTYAILKRGEEARVVLDAHRRPKFVEDVLRDALLALPARFPRLPDTTVAAVDTRSEESIHKYDVTASHRASFGELRRASTA